MKWDTKLFERHLKTRRFGRENVYIEQVGSTNDWMLNHADRFVLTGGVVVADHQTAGRGRFERQWHDVATTSILASVLFQYVRPEHAAWLTMLPAIAAAEVLSEFVPTTHCLSLKWPNDVLMNKRKLGGVLGQSSARGEHCLCVVGLGLNVNLQESDFPTELRECATSVLRELQSEMRREPLLAGVLARWEELYDILLNNGVDSLRARWETLGPAKGSYMERCESGKILCGHYCGLGEQGQLRLQDALGTTHEFRTGDVSL